MQDCINPVWQVYCSNPAKQIHLNVASSSCFKSHFRSCQAVPPQCCINIVLQGLFQILPRSFTSMLHHYCVARPILDPAKQFHLSVASILCCKAHLGSCQLVSPQCCIEFVLQGPFQILSISFMSMLHQYCVAGTILDPIKQFHLNVASILCCKSHFRACQATSPQCCIKYELQGPFQILPSSFTSMLNQYCIARFILDPVEQFHLNVASILCCKANFRSYQTVSPQYCINIVLQVPFQILPNSSTSMLHQYCIVGSNLDPVKQFHLNVASMLRCKSHFRSCQSVLPQCCIHSVLQVPFQILSSSFTSMLHQYCVVRLILDPAKQFHLSVASIMCCKSHFRPCQAVPSQCCINIVL